MIRKPRQKNSPSELLIALLAFLTLAAAHIKPGITLWHHHSGQTLTDIQLLPKSLWGFGTTPVIMTTATGALIKTGTTTKYGCFIVHDYDLRIWNYDAKTDSVIYITD